MSTRAPVNRIYVEFGEDVTWTPPDGATKYLAWRRTDIMPPFELSTEHVSGPTTYGGDPPRWTEFGGYDIENNAVIGETHPAAVSPVRVIGFEDIATATGFTMPWDSLYDAVRNGLAEAVMVIPYGRDFHGFQIRAMQRDIFVLPQASSTDAGVIAAQERRLLQTLLLARERAGAQGGVKRRDAGEGVGEEYESLAALDRRVAEVRARIVWFEQAAEGNALPRQEHW